MPSIDVSDVLLGGDIAGEPFTVIRRTSANNANGQAVITPAAPVTMVGSVTPGSDNEMVVAEAFQAQKGTITVITTFRLRGVSKDPGTGVSYAADLVGWGGSFYIVSVLNDWTKYGGGFIEAHCIQYDWPDTPPT